MTPRWAVWLENGAALGGLRRAPALDVSVQPDGVWLRGSDESLFERMLALPGARLFSVLPDGQLVPHRARVPHGRLPAGPWQPLERWLQVTLEPPALPGRLPGSVPLRIVPSTVERDANVLLTAQDSWTEYACLAPQVRLQR